jgi:hypothetical protein
MHLFYPLVCFLVLCVFAIYLISDNLISAASMSHMNYTRQLANMTRQHTTLRATATPTTWHNT